MKKYDYALVGCGITSIVLAERLGSLGKSVIIIEKNNHVGGLAFDYKDPNSGIILPKYGPHYFHTDDDEIFKYLSQFTEWIDTPFEIRSNILGELYNFPVNRNTLNQLFEQEFKTHKECIEFLDEETRNMIFDIFFRGYTEKQWGKKAESVKFATDRYPIRTDTDNRYFKTKYQCMPKTGYTNMFLKMLKKSKATIIFDKTFNEVKNFIEFDNLIWTGKIDEFYNYEFGELEYRSLKFDNISFYNLEFYQDWCQINYPDKRIPYTRIIEPKHVTKQKTPHTAIIIETPCSTGEPMYPIPSISNNDKYIKYKNKSNTETKVFFIGRLATYKYIGMSECVRNTLDFFENLKNETQLSKT